MRLPPAAAAAVAALLLAGVAHGRTLAPGWAIIGADIRPCALERAVASGAIDDTIMRWGGVRYIGSTAASGLPAGEGGWVRVRRAVMLGTCAAPDGPPASTAWEVLLERPAASAHTHVAMTPLSVADGALCTAWLDPGRGGPVTLDLVAACGAWDGRGWRWDDATLSRRQPDDRWHATPSVLLDARGALTVAGAMHYTPWQLWRAPTATPAALEFVGVPMTDAEIRRTYVENKTGFADNGVGGLSGTQVTYPAFLADGERSWAMWRYATRPTASFTERAVAVGLARLDGDVWSDVGPLAVRRGWTAYTGRLATAPDGALWVLGAWREGTGGGTLTRPWLIRSADAGATWTDAAGEAVTLPLQPGQAPVPLDGGMTTTMGLAVDAAGRPHVLLAPRGAARVVRVHDGQGWTSVPAPGGAHALVRHDGRLLAATSSLALHERDGEGWRRVADGAGALRWPVLVSSDGALWAQAMSEGEDAVRVLRLGAVPR